MPMSAREAALRALSAHRKSGAWTEVALSHILQKEKLDDRDAALASRIFYGVVQNLALCDFYISKYSSVKTSKMEPLVLDILRLSVYQLIFLSKVPVNAAVSEGVELVKKHSNPRAAGLVNAVLRKISANLDCLPKVSAQTDAEKLSILYSHPIWLVEAFIERLGTDDTEQLLQANNGETVINVMVNTVKTDIDEAMKALAHENVSAALHPWLTNCLELKNAHHLERLRSFSDGSVYVQDPAAMLAVLAADPKPDMFVIDGCAAPGGKSFASAMLMQDKGRILSCDVNEKKTARIADGAKRLNLSSIQTRIWDAKLPDENLFGQADLVIADVPCSGFGVIRKKPEIRYKPQEETKRLPELQLAILNNLSNYVKPGGVLLYSTCTLLRRENEDVVESFLAINDKFTTEPFLLPGPAGTVETGMLTLWPHIHGTDGFFICRLRRRL